MKTPGICDIAHATMPDSSPLSSEYAASATFVEGLNPAFSVRGRSVGTCTVEVRDESARWVTELQLQG
ncbi:MAG TPA: hypothetical protein VF794_36930 [Archangium sp.]|uniref:hypothetical protein n=1 Tax=Archangium sp. TaxID=1872627 RepID=UPI002ED77313